MDAVTAELSSRFSRTIHFIRARAARRGRLGLRFCAAPVIGGVGQNAQISSRGDPREKNGQDADDKQCAFAHLFKITQ